MQNYKLKDIIILSLKVIAIVACLLFIAENYFFEIIPSAISPIFILSFAVLIVLNWYTKAYKKAGYFKLAHIPLIVIPLFFVVHFRAGVNWAVNTFPLTDANLVMLTLAEPFDNFAYSMIRLYLKTTLPQALIITIILTIFLYTIFANTKKRLTGVLFYFVATIALLFSQVPLWDYIHILTNNPKKNASFSKFFVENYINPDSTKITAPAQKRNLILVYIESMEIAFADKEHGGNQEENLIPELTELASKNINFGRDGELTGGGFSSHVSGGTFPAYMNRSLGIPCANYRRFPILRHYKSLYKILNDNGYKQIFFQGNSGLYSEFRHFSLDQKIDEVYGPDEVIQKTNLNIDELIKKHGGKSAPDKDAFRFATQILDTLTEPFALTFFTIDTHAPHGIYDPDCIKASDEDNKDELLKASARCVSRELDKFLISVKSKPFYNNTTIVVFGDHPFMGTRLVKESKSRKWIDIFVNAPKSPIKEDKRAFLDVDMLPTILSSINFKIEGDKLGLGTDLFSGKKTLVEQKGIDSLNIEFDKIPNHLLYESYLLQKRKKQN